MKTLNLKAIFAPIAFSRKRADAFMANLESNLMVKTVKKTIGAVGVTGCDYNFVTAANMTAQPIDLGELIPAFAQILSVVVKTKTQFAGTSLTAFGVTIGTTTGGTEIASSADLILANAINQPAVGAGYTLIAITAAKKKIWIGGTPTGANWAAVLAGKLEVYVTYLDLPGQD